MTNHLSPETPTTVDAATRWTRREGAEHVRCEVRQLDRSHSWEVSLHRGGRRVYSRLCLTHLVALAHAEELRILAEREAGE